VGSAGAAASIWRPPQWGSGTATYSIQTATAPSTVEDYVSGSQVVAGQGISGGVGAGQTSTTYVFDAVLVAAHRQEVVVTKYPVQTGANISYHAYIMPAQVVLEIGMSDAMDAFVAGVWTGAATKSASAFKVLSQLKNTRQPLTLSTRLYTYSNMVITSVTAEETSKTISSLRARVTFEEVFVANAGATTTGGSARPQDTQSTPQGTVTGQSVDTTTSTQYGVPACSIASLPVGSDYVCTGQVMSSNTAATGDTAIGAGNASSVPTSNLPATGGGS
jgi:hypothetical protein